MKAPLTRAGAGRKGLQAAWAAALTGLLSLGAARPAVAQTAVPGFPQTTPDLRDFPYADSLSLALAGQQQWAALDSAGRAALRLGTDYPALRQRLGYAALQRNRPVAAVRHYGRAVAADPTDFESRYQLALAYLQLGQPGPARLVLQPLPDSTRRALHLEARRAASGVGAEAGFKPAASARRGVAGYGRVGVSSQLSTRLALWQAVTYYGQTVRLPERGPTREALESRQGEYAALLTAQVAAAVQLKAGYHLIYNAFGARHYGSHVGYLAAQYGRPAWRAQAGFYAGHLNGGTRTQADVQALAYLTGNFNLYAFGRGSLVFSDGQTAPNVLLGLGGRLLPRLWVEGFGSGGTVPVLLERDGADVYNLLDPLRGRLGAATYWQATPHWRLHLYYTRARLQERNTSYVYTQHALTGGLVWTW